MSTGESQRYGELDSLRGLAAATVVLGHLAMLVFSAPRIPGSSWAYWRHILEAVNKTPLTVFMSGGSAVRFFFVLSGFVLMLPYIRRKENPYGPYLVKRICRIYLPYLAAVALAILCNYVLAGHPLPGGFTGAISETWAQPVSGKVILQHVAMLGRFPVARFNTVLWSLVQEMRISIFYPLIALAVLKLSWRALLSLVLVVEAVFLLLPLAFPKIDMGLASFPAMIHWSSMFILGAFLALHRERLQQAMAAMSRPAKAALGLGTFLVYSMGIKIVWGEQFQTHIVGRLARIPAIASWANPNFVASGTIWIGDWMAALGAAVAVCFALTDRRTKAVLNHTLVLWTGRASYSLYLVHGTVLFALAYLLIGTPFLYLLVPLYLGLTIALTLVFYRFIEIPTMNLGRNLASRITRRKNASELAKEPAPTAAA